jgi:hypothetical protein
MPQISPCPAKGRRYGPLSAGQKDGANQCRRLKRICIRCKKDKQPVNFPFKQARLDEVLTLTVHSFCY